MPKQLSQKIVYQSKLIIVKDVDIEYNNKEKRIFQIIEKPDSVVVVPLTKNREVIFIKEYMVALDSFMLDLPGGRIEKGLSLEETAVKELQEEIGFKPNVLKKLATFSISPGYLTQQTTAFLATDLVESKLDGDEVENLELIYKTLGQINNMIQRGVISDARTVASLLLVLGLLK